MVRATVLDQGKTWLDRAFVVNDWYISAYEPILGSRGTRVGMLYVGFLETPFRQSKLATLVAICAAFFAVTVISIPLFLRWAGSIFRPLEKIVETIGAVEGGDMGARILGGRGNCITLSPLFRIPESCHTAETAPRHSRVPQGRHR